MDRKYFLQNYASSKVLFFSLGNSRVGSSPDPSFQQEFSLTNSSWSHPQDLSRKGKLTSDREQLTSNTEQLHPDRAEVPKDKEELPSDREQLAADREQLPPDREQLPPDRTSYKDELNTKASRGKESSFDGKPKETGGTILFDDIGNIFLLFM